MSRGLEELKRMAYENACCRCQYCIDNKCTNKGECVWKTIEKELNVGEMEHKLRIRLENINYGLVREKQENEKKVKALVIIKNIGILKPYETIGGQCWLETMCDATKITKDNCDLLKEVLL